MTEPTKCGSGHCDHEHWQTSNDGDYVDRRRTNFHDVATKYYLRSDGTYRIAVLTPHGQATIEVDEAGLRIDPVAAQSAHEDVTEPDDALHEAAVEVSDGKIEGLGSGSNPFVTVSGGGKKWHRDPNCKWLLRGKAAAVDQLGRTHFNSHMRLQEALQQKPYLKPCKHCSGG